MNKKLCTLVFCFFAALPIFSNSKGEMYKLLIENYRTRKIVELTSPEKEIIKKYIDKLDSNKGITLIKMPIEYLIILEYEGSTFYYRFSDDYLANDDNYAIIVDDEFKKIIENLGI